MAEQVLMIALSPTMEEGKVVRWQKKEGDRVDAGDVLCEVETDKATMDYESSSEGTLLKILVDEGDQAAIGEVIAIIGEEGESFDHLLEGDSSQKQIDTGSTKEDKEQSTKPAGDGSKDLPIDHGFGVQRKSETLTDLSADTRIKASPLARKIAEMNRLSLNDIRGTGPNGRIIKVDIEKYATEESIHKESDLEKKGDELQAGTKRLRANDPISATPGDEEIPVSTKRKIIAQRLAESKYNAPHYYLTVSVAVDNLIKTRKSLNESQENKVSFNAFLIKYVAEALKKHSMLNASWSGDTILKRRNADIGLAVAQSDGLITPVVRDCGYKGVVAIDEELRELIDKARNNKLMPEEYQNASFSISNLGSFGIEEFTAVINPPGSAILAIGEMKKVPVVDKEENIIIQTQMKMTLSCDHRVVDGAVGAAFLKDLKDIIEDPIRALF